MDLFESKRLGEERAAVCNEMQSLSKKWHEEKRSATNEELEHFDKLDAAQKEMGTKIETLRRAEKVAELVPQQNSRAVEVRSYKPTAEVTAHDQELAFKAWCLRGAGYSSAVRSNMVEAAHKVGLDLNDTQITIRLGNGDAVRGQTIGSNSAGGYLQNADMVAGIDQALKFYGGMRRAARVVRTDTGSPIHWATLDDTSNVGAIVTENNAPSTSDQTFGTVTFGSFKYTSQIFPISLELLQDSQFPVLPLVSENLGIRLGRITNTHFTTGTGTTLPRGFTIDANVGKTTALAASFTYSELVDFYHSVDIAYREDPSCTWMCHDNFLGAVKKLLSTTGQPLWQPGLNGPASDTILGEPYVVNNDMASSFTSNAKVAGFGAFNRYIIRDVADVNVLILRERYMDQFAVGVLAYMRCDGALLNNNAVKLFKMGTGT